MSNTGRSERRGLSHLTLREEPISDPTLIEHLDRARVKTTGPRAEEHVIGTPLEDRDIDLRQRQLSRQHHPRRTASGDHHRMLAHTPTSASSVRNCTASPIIGSTSPRDLHVVNNTCI